MNLLEQLVQDHREAWGLKGLGHPRAVLVTPSYDTSRHVVALVFDHRRDPQVVVKVSRRPGDDSGLRREAAVLRRLEELRGSGDDVPRVLALVPFGAGTALVESGLSGPALSPERVRADSDAVLRAGTELVERLPVTGTLTGSWYDELVRAPVQRMLSCFPSLSEDDLAARTHDALADLTGSELPAVLEHGDLSHPNLLLVAPDRIGAVDWERSVERGVPGHDLVYLLAYVSEALTGAATMPERVTCFDQALGSPSGWARPQLASHLERRGVAPALLDSLLLVSVVRAACTLAERLLGDSGQELEQRAGATSLAARDRDMVLWRHLLDRRRRQGEGVGP